MKSAPAIAIDYRPSRRLAAAIGVVAVAATIALALSGMSLGFKLALGAGACAYAAFELCRFLLAAPRRAVWHAAGHWRILDGDGVEHTAELAGSVVRGDWIVLRLRRHNRAITALILAPDNSDADLRRQLRVRLAHAAGDKPAAV
jgi:toxin CptA